MFGNVIDKIVHHGVNINSLLQATGLAFQANLADLKKAEPAVKPSHDCPVQFERRVYKRSDPIDIVRPTVTW
ncbi:hypothetical protein ANCCAN_02835 [Ancylostoma caninum]|uniref:Uncharacterized protein n=1 Tax=Ancylostoma caninum TaxID=29170 RepID=A0A368H5M1_ANCCA|nr:hypothetical protein ANCCAN_02835 [Ancylostoma caninum]